MHRLDYLGGGPRRLLGLLGIALIASACRLVVREERPMRKYFAAIAVSVALALAFAVIGGAAAGPADGTWEVQLALDAASFRIKTRL
jgi:hypothetical protein